MLLLRFIRPILMIVLCLIVMTTQSFGQQGGKSSIKGKVTDSKTGEALPSVNVAVKGTYYGAVTDIDGKFTIPNINPGTYIIDVSLLGYKTTEFTAFKVNASEAAILDVKLEETVLSLGQEVVIVGDKPLFNIEETQSRRSIGSEDIKAAAVQSVQDVVALQAGVVQSDNEIHIRGGRTYENAFLLDGVSVQDPLAGTGFGLQLSPSAIQEVEVLTGGYNAEYGQATSGIVNITTKDGTVNYAGSLSYKRDHFGFNKNSRSNFNSDIIDASLSGPEPLTSYIFPALGAQIPGSLSFFGTFYANLTDGYTRWSEKISNDPVFGYQPIGDELSVPRQLYSSLLDSNTFWSPRRSNNWSLLTKLTWKPSAILKISYTYTSSLTIDQNTQSVQATLEHVEANPGFQYEFLRIPDSSNTFTQQNKQHSFSMTHTLSSKTFYEIRFSHYSAHVRGDANGKGYMIDPLTGKIKFLYNQPKDIITLPIDYYNLHNDTIGVIPGDGFYDIGNPTRWRDHYIGEYTFKADLTHHFSEQHKLKTGLEMRFQNMQMIDVLSPWVEPLGIDYDKYEVSPALGALYVQDNITLKGMILNFGLRLDYWEPGKYVDDAVKLSSTLSNLTDQDKQAYVDNTFLFIDGRRMKARLSPRLGISHPVSDNQTLFFSYGHFSKLPRPQFIYSKLVGSTSRSSSQVIGNPNLNPETTVSYELGLRNQLSGSDVLTVTAYYKDIFDYIAARTIRSTQSRFAGGSYTKYVNQDYSRIRGLELEYKTRFSDWLRGVFSGSYSISTGKSSNATEAAFNTQQGLEENIKEIPMVFDRPLQLQFTLNINSAKNKPLFGFGSGWLEDYNMFIRMFYQSGKRYTRQILADTLANGRLEYFSDNANPNSGVADPWFYVDLNFEKYFDITVGKLVLSLEIQNILNNKNAQIINPTIGKAYEYNTADGKPTPTPNSWNDPHYPDLTYPVDAFPYTPARYLNPRTFRFGMSLRF